MNRLIFSRETTAVSWRNYKGAREQAIHSPKSKGTPGFGQLPETPQGRLRR